MYEIIEQINESLDINRACSSLGVSDSGFTDWLRKCPEKNDPYDMKLRDELQKIALEFPFYGYRRITAALQRLGFEVNHKRVLRIMREDNLLCMKKKAFKLQTTESNHDFRVYPNLIKGLEVIGINKVWVSDITYIRLLTEFVYLAVIIDVFSRKCIGWCLGRSLDAQLALNALNMALSDRKGMDLSNLIHHSDRGVQYASIEYVNLLKAYDIRISMSRKASPYDNAFMESFIKTLKCEEVYLCEYDSFNEARSNIERFIEEVYNKKRLHSSIGYLPPNEFEDGLDLNKRREKYKVIVA